MPKVPSEILIHIASFLPNGELARLLSVNRLFFDLSMRARHWKLSVCVYHHDIKPETKKLEKYLERSWSKYVRVLRLDARRTAWIEEPIELYVIDSTIMFDTLRTMTSLQDVYLDFNDHMEDYFPDDLRLFLQEMWNSLPTSQLTRLRLRGNIPCTALAGPLNQDFRVLRELSLDFTGYIDDETSKTYQKLLPFINSLCPRVRLLSIKCPDDSKGLWDIFTELQQFDQLESLELKITVNSIFHSEYWIRLQHILFLNSPRLSSLKLKITGISKRDSAMGYELSSLWLSGRVTLCRLKVLDIDPYNFGPEKMGAFRTAISRCQNTLEDLTIRGDSAYRIQQLAEVIPFLQSCSALSSLTLYVGGNIMDIEFFDALSTLSSLKILSIHWIYPHLAEFRREAIAFVWHLGSRSYVNWELSDLGIYYENVPVDRNVMMAIARSIPSLKTLWRQDSEKQEVKAIFYETILTATDVAIIKDRRGCRGCKLATPVKDFYPHRPSCKRSKVLPSTTSRSTPLTMK
ncbi:hypothetical protein BDQ17DRAFT_1426548 [Cyathus striatus]|nr:hypothetical protein BDQ17DRAFT_1426548 [Cyathus striatus]